jgi:hypothetical protein
LYCRTVSAQRAQAGAGVRSRNASGETDAKECGDDEEASRRGSASGRGRSGARMGSRDASGPPSGAEPPESWYAARRLVQAPMALALSRSMTALWPPDARTHMCEGSGGRGRRERAEEEAEGEGEGVVGL